MQLLCVTVALSVSYSQKNHSNSNTNVLAFLDWISETQKSVHS